MSRNLPWLAIPSALDRQQLAALSAPSTESEFQRLRELVMRDWNDSELSSLGRKLRKRGKAIADKPQAVTNTGCISHSLLIISSNTVSHMIDSLNAGALRVGILLKCSFVEYQEPETWLSENTEQLALEPPNTTLLALDRRSLGLQAPAGNGRAADASVESALARVRRIVDRLGAATGGSVIVQTLEAAAADPQISLDAWLPGSPRRLIAAFNEGLAQCARDGLFKIFDVAAIANETGLMRWHPGRFWYVAKLPFAPDCIPIYVHRLMQLLAAMVGKSRRVLVLDLDNTLWGGVIGDDGLEGIVLGPGSGRGEAHIAIQRLALQYKERGILLCIASKNSEDTARNAMRDHPDMLLRDTDIALFQVNWQDKASNIKSMSEALGLGLDAFVFVDDNPAERKQVRDSLPMVAVPELPSDPAEWIPIIQAAGYFEQIAFSAEDHERTEYYRSNALRNLQSQVIGNHEEFLASLKMIMTVAPFNEIGRQRIVQLIAKSNQFNLTTRRYSDREIAGIESSDDFEALQVRLEDLFGDNGMVCVVICRKQELIWNIDTWIMSCRVLGRGVEQAALNILVKRARSNDVRELHGRYIPTARNGLVRDHYAKLGFTKLEESDTGETLWRLAIDDFVAIQVPIEVRIQSNAN